MHGKNWKARAQYLSPTQSEPQDLSILTIETQNPQKPKARKPEALHLTRNGLTYSMWESPGHIGWVEQEQAVTRLCELTTGSDALALSKKPKIVCPFAVTMPLLLRPIGIKQSHPGDDSASEVWFSEGTQKLTGTSYAVKVYSTDQHRVVKSFSTGMGQPLAVGFAGANTWMVVAERNTRSLRRYGKQGECLGMVQFRDHLLDVKGLADGSVILALYGGSQNYLRKMTTNQLKETRCSDPVGHTSPLQYAMSHDAKVDLKTAMADSSLWQQAKPDSKEDKAAFAARPLADKDTQAGTGSDTATKPVDYKLRPLFIFPWVGGDDALGLQYGAVSVPLMDEMQNESVRATFLYGPASHFPYQELSLTSTRFAPTINLSLYREQTFNGAFYKPGTNKTEIWDSFLDEKGVRLESVWTKRMLGGTGTAGAAVKYAYLKPFIGPTSIRHGFLVEPGASFALVHQLGPYAWTNAVSGRVAPAAANKHFDYNVLAASSTVAVTLPAWSKLTLGLEGSRTRGHKERELKELYRPLKTFVPGSGAGYNQNSFPLGPDNSGLFDAGYGDTQARAKADYTIPVIRDLDKEIWILYFERLDFTAFTNYGAAWNGPSPYRGYEHLIPARGFHFDLLFENKGVKFNLGVGAGQVIGHQLAAYLNAGFDAFF